MRGGRKLKRLLYDSKGVVNLENLGHFEVLGRLNM